MKKPFVAALLLVGAAAMVASLAYASIEQPSELGAKLVNAQMVKMALSSRVQRLHTSAGPDPDTVWFGHSFTDHTGFPGPIKNYWNLYVGDNQPGVADVKNAVWDFDNTTGFNHYVGDSLAGWWPYRRQYNATGGLTLTDDQRPWWAIDIGNQVNYVINQGGGGKRTKGVVGVWHADPGSAAGNAVTWTPLAGTKSAWCGLRIHGDNSVVDQVTGQPFNQVAYEFNKENGAGTGATAKRFPGYADQWDQILYKDIVAPAATPLSISFLYRTRMSTGVVTTASTRVGWFHGDPLAVVAGNFISSSAAGVNAPIDSFSVYVGAPVNDAACVYSDGVTRKVFDPQRRWFSEVIRIFESGVPYYEIFSTFGNQPADTASATPSVSVTIPATNVDAIRNATGNSTHNVRLVFRVKTNHDFSDGDSRASGFTSNSRGAR
jgi:hypothetical protein